MSGTESSREASPAQLATFVSVVVPARNAAATLGDCLLALRAQTYSCERFEVILVDDGSTDTTVSVASRFAGVRVLQIPPSGPAAARNRGVEVSRGDIVLFTDADCAPDPDWVETMLAPFKDPQVVASKGTYRSEQRSWTARFVQKEYEGRYEIMRRRETIDFVDTYAAAYRRDALLDVGGFDESFPVASVEDQELSFRIARRGARMVFAPGAVVRHRHADRPHWYFRKKLKIAYWKMRVLGRFPEKALRDSHTPWGLKLEVLFLGAALAAVLPAAVVGPWWLPVVFLAAFFTFAVSSSLRLCRGEPALAVRAPAFVALRALALVLGMAGGLFAGRLRTRRAGLHALERAREDCQRQHA
jgi:glycosyltransferase involved in cell wall biosynthesis